MRAFIFTLLSISLATKALSQPGSSLRPISETKPGCEAWRFEAPTGSLSPKEQRWLKTLLDFVYSTRGSVRWVAEEPRAKTPISGPEMAKILNDPDFSKFAGSEISSAANDLIEARKALEANQHPVARTKGKKIVHDSGDRRIGLHYLDRRDTLYKLVEAKFGVHRTSTAQYCD